MIAINQVLKAADFVRVFDPAHCISFTRGSRQLLFPPICNVLGVDCISTHIRGRCGGSRSTVSVMRDDEEVLMSGCPTV